MRFHRTTSAGLERYRSVLPPLHDSLCYSVGSLGHWRSRMVCGVDGIKDIRLDHLGQFTRAKQVEAHRMARLRFSVMGLQELVADGGNTV